MAKPRARSVLVFIAVLSLAAVTFSHADGPPAAYLYPDSVPVHGNLFFPGGSPLERSTGQRDAWYAIYQTSLYPGYAYAIIVRHKGDPARMRLYAMDNHPFDKVSVKIQLALKRVDSAYNNYKEPSYQAAVSLPEKARSTNLFLLLEWLPPTGHNRPVPVSMQVVSTGYGQLMSRGSQWGRKDGWKPESALQGRRPVVIPVPER